MAPVGLATPPAGSRVTANLSKVFVSGRGGSLRNPRPAASTLNTPAGTDSDVAMAHSS